MANITCESCGIIFEGRRNRRYCCPKCKRKAEMQERERKRKARYDAWLSSLLPEDRAFWEGIPEFSTEDLQELSMDSLKKL